jgi:hypothetical protein
MDHLSTRHFSRRGLLKTSLAASAAAMPISSRLHTASALNGPATPVGGGDPDVHFAEFEQLVVTRMAELRIPGVAIGVIAGDREQAPGFGVTNIDHPLPVDTDTLFQIGSTTKTFTTSTALLEQHDSELALKLIDAGIVRRGASHELAALRRQALDQLRERYQQLNPFKFIVYSEWAVAELPPITAPAVRSQDRAA